MSWFEIKDDGTPDVVDVEKQQIYDRYYPFCVVFANIGYFALYLKFRHDFLGLPKPIEDYIIANIGFKWLSIISLLSFSLYVVFFLYTMIRIYGFSGMSRTMKTGREYAKNKWPYRYKLTFLIILGSEILLRIL